MNCQPHCPSTCGGLGEASLPDKIVAGKRTLARTAFTLIELLTVIAIIGILAAIILPVTSKVRTSARAAQCKAHIRQWAVAAQLYAEDNKGTLPNTSSAKEKGGTEDGSHYPEVEMVPYMNIKIEPPITTAKATAAASKMRCQIQNWRYGFNRYIAWEPISKFMQPTRQVFATCSTKAWFDGTAKTSTTSCLGPTPKPHSGKVNVAYLDSSVKTLFVTQLTWGDFTRDTSYHKSTDNTRYMFNGDTQYDQ